MSNPYSSKDTISLFAKHDFEDEFIWGLSGKDIKKKVNSSNNIDLTSNQPSIPNSINSFATPPEFFYFNYNEEILHTKKLGLKNFRFSLSWNHIITNEKGFANKEAISFYNQVLDACLLHEIEPFVTLCNLCLPDELEKIGGWSNRDIIYWFENYVSICVAEFKTKIKYWIILNEPSVFTGANYYLTINKFRKKSDNNFLPALHHALLCQAIGFKIIKNNIPNSQVGTTFSSTHVVPRTNSFKDLAAANRVDALLNRTFIEPSLGLGYPIDDLSFLKNIKKHILQGDNEMIIVQFDFVGIQNYKRVCVSFNMYAPFINAVIIAPQKINQKNINLENINYSKTIYAIVKKFSSYDGVKKIIVTDNDYLINSELKSNNKSQECSDFYRSNLEHLLLAKKIKGKVAGYFIQSSLVDSEFSEFFKSALI